MKRVSRIVITVICFLFAVLPCVVTAESVPHGYLYSLQEAYDLGLLTQDDLIDLVPKVETWDEKHYPDQLSIPRHIRNMIAKLAEIRAKEVYYYRDPKLHYKKMLDYYGTYQGNHVFLIYYDHKDDGPRDELEGVGAMGYDMLCSAVSKRADKRGNDNESKLKGWVREEIGGITFSKVYIGYEVVVCKMR